jgi:aminomethyltransferase
MAEGREVGEVTSGTHSPTLDRSIAMGYVSTKFSEPGQPLTVNIRDRMVEAEVVRLPFYSSKR